MRRRVEKVPFVGFAAQRIDAWTYNQMLLRAFAQNNAVEKYDRPVWMGDYAQGRTPGLPTVCYVQGAPGTDARSILRQNAEVKRLAGTATALKWQIMVRIRMSRLGLPPFKNADRFIVGSQESKRTLRKLWTPSDRSASRRFHIPSTLSFSDCPGKRKQARRVPPPPAAIAPKREMGRCKFAGWAASFRANVWDLFLDGAALAIRQGVDLRLTIIGGIGFIPGYEKLIEAFAFPDRLEWKKGIPRQRCACSPAPPRGPCRAKR